ncbi:MAG: MATE family efflux transporter [Anaerolineae bacterium]|nr:MATE family efflux transporter [Candidatus Roseilinea sp.]MDW8450676.1 MATE family efflux transporter [Anaerolineae bacterium]
MSAVEETIEVSARAGAPGLRRRVFALAWPVIAENFLETLLGIVDTWLVAQLAISALALAGVGAAVQVMQFLLSALSALSIGASVLVAQAVGARNFARANDLARQSLVWSLIISIPLALAGLWAAGPVIGLFGMDPAAAEIGVSYMQVTMGTVVVLVGLFIGSGVLRGAGDSRTPLIVTTIANLINIPLTWALIFGRLGLPELGPVGSAWASFIARAVALAILLVVLWRGRAGIRIGGPGAWRPDAAVAKGVLSIGVPAALEQILASGAFFVLTVVVGQLGTAMLAANRIAINALSLAFLPGFGFAIAATALVGQSVGARNIREGEAATRIAAEWALIWMSSFGLILVIFAPQVLQAFTGDPVVVRAGVDALRVMAFSMPPLAILFVAAGGLRGMGNTRIPLVIFGGGLWAITGLAALAVNTIGGGLIAVWSMFVVGTPVMAWLMVRSFRAAAREFQYGA